MKKVPVSWFLTTIQDFKFSYLELIALAIAMRLLTFVEPFIFQVLIDRIIPFQRSSSLWVVITILVCVSLFEVVFVLISAVLRMRTAHAITSRIGNRIFRHLIYLPIGFFSRWSAGHLLSRIGEVDTINRFLLHSVVGFVIDISFAVIFLFVLYSISPELALIVSLAIPTYAIVLSGYGPYLRKRIRREFDASSNYRSKVISTLSNASVFKTHVAEPMAISFFSRNLTDLLRRGYDVGLASTVNSQILYITERVFTAGIILKGSFLVFDGSLTLGQLVAFYLLATRVFQPISGVIGIWELWQNVGVARQRLADLVLEKTELDPDRVPLPSQDIRELAFQAVSFQYPDSQLILNRLSFSARIGEILVVVGQSGTGKSTAGKIAGALLQPTEGYVRIDRQDMSDFTLQSVRQKIVYVSQEPILVEGTIRENLKIAAQHATDAELQEVLAQANCEEFMLRLPDGLDTHLGDGASTLSGGQRQRLTIARALLSEASVLIFDEPTSALDAIAERRIWKLIDNLSVEKVVIVITHRPPTFRNPSQVISLDSVSIDLTAGSTVA